MPKIGLKLWSTNIEYIPAAQELFSRNIFDYIELFIVPDSMGAMLKWKELDIPYVLHAPHSAAGLNLGDRLKRDMNFELVRQVNGFFGVLSPAFVIFHSGVGNDLDEPVSQFQFFKSEFPVMYQNILIENKPQVGLRNERCLGASPEEIHFLLTATRCGFCLDFGHAICYSVAAKKDWRNVISDFLAMSPEIYHLSDGFYTAKDSHERLGEGEFDLPYLLGLINRDKYVTLETKRKDIKRQNCGSAASLQDFMDEVIFIKSLVSV